MIPVYFFLPEKPSSLPASIAEYWSWQTTSPDLSPYWGRYHWVLQTYLYFKDYGIECDLIHQLPESGIVITHRDCLEYEIKPSQHIFFVVLLVDRVMPHPYGNFHVIHNPDQKVFWNLTCKYIPPWPQVSLIPRNKERGSTFERVGYFGYPVNLVAELSSDAFLDQISIFGLSLEIPEPKDWNSFLDFDAILAIRNFGRSNEHINKPSLKLYNAWAAGIPAILGYESAYRYEGKAGKNYIEATTVLEVIDGLRTLQDDAAYRGEIVNEGLIEYACKYTPEITIKKWEQFLLKSIFPAYKSWSQSRLKRELFWLAGRVREPLLWRFEK
jgi:hypothetical protein